MTDDEPLERSESGQPIYRHQARDREWTLPENAGANLDEITEHLEKHIGPIAMVYHEILSDLVHLDVLHIAPSEAHPYHLLVTSGVSDLPMHVPEGVEEFNRVELLMALPPEWPITQKAFEDEANYWPVRWLKMVGRLPHEYETWIGWGHTIPNGDPAGPIADTRFVGCALIPPYELSTEFFRLPLASGEAVHF